MSINFSFNVTKKLVVNGREYSSADQLPENLRHAFDNAAGNDESAGGLSVTRNSALKIIVNGKEYKGIEEMPDDVRRLYSMAIRAGSGEVKSAGTVLTPGLIEAASAVGGVKVGLFQRLFPKTLLRWAEPEAIRKAAYESDKRSFSRIWPVIIIASFLAIWIPGRLAPGMDVVPLYLSVSFILATIFFIMWIGKVTPVSVSITDTGIVRGHGRSATVWSFRNIAHCEISSINTAGGRQSMIVIHSKQGRKNVVGIDPSLPIKDIQLLLECKGVKVVMNPGSL